ncbi:hypothetical protein KC336_g19896, partial [Hortaea werneckii]
ADASATVHPRNNKGLVKRWNEVSQLRNSIEEGVDVSCVPARLLTPSNWNHRAPEVLDTQQV